MTRATSLRFINVFLCFVAIACLSARELHALDNGLAKTPPMGWNSWNKFACNVSEELIKQIADAMVTSGMKDAGYQYIVIDDCWQVDRDSQGNIIADSKRFPSGIKALADYIHAKGLKFGIYSDAGTLTCQKRPGSRGYEFQGCPAVRRLGRRLFEIRLVLNRHSKPAGILLNHARRVGEIWTTNGF